MYRGTFFDIVFYTFDNWKKKSSEKINALHRWSAKVFYIVIHSHSNLIYYPHKDNIHIELKWQQTDFLKRVREIHRSRSYLSVPLVCFLIFGMLLSFQYLKNCWRSHILVLHALQKASDILVIPILKLLGVQGYISDCHRYQFKTYCI